MALDNFKNGVKVTLSTGYDAAATSLVLTGGDGAKCPTLPANAVWWNYTDYASPEDDPNVEVIRVASRSTDTLTVSRAAEPIADNSTAKTHNTAGKVYKLTFGLTAKTLNTDLADAGHITTGTMATARLGSGTANSATRLRGDQVWSAISSSEVATALNFIPKSRKATYGMVTDFYFTDFDGIGVEGHDFIGVNATAAIREGHLPPTGNWAVDRELTIMKTDSSANVVRIVPSTQSQTINGSSATISLSTQYSWRRLKYIGSGAWVIIGSG